MGQGHEVSSVIEKKETEGLKVYSKDSPSLQFLIPIERTGVLGLLIFSKYARHRTSVP